MMRKIIWPIWWLAAWWLAIPVGAGTDFGLKVKFFQGIKGGTLEPLQVVTSSYLNPLAASHPVSEEGLGQEIKRLKQIFNLSDLKLMTEAYLSWDDAGLSSKEEKTFHVFYSDDEEYVIRAVSLDPASRKFRIEIDERSGESKKNLLNTEAVLSSSKTAVFGFENSRAKSYFLSLQPAAGLKSGVSGGVGGGVTGGVTGGVAGGVEGGVAGGVKGGVAGGLESNKVQQPAGLVPTADQIEKLEKGAVLVKGNIRPPRRIYMAAPVFPFQAQKSKIQGLVVLGVRIGTDGRVQDVIVFSPASILDQAAADAVKQWIFEPLKIDGRPMPAVFTVQVRFSIQDEESAMNTINPRIRYKQNPVYPTEARMGRVEGTVILEARIDEQGNVAGVKVLRSIPKLDQAAIDAVKQWKYQPVIIDGKPVSVVTTVTIRFQLK